jgi:hypothetical protein
MIRIYCGVALATAALLSGCATITRGSNDQWVVNSTPSGAKVETTNGFYCAETPCSIKIPRKADFTATVSKTGYKSAKVVVTHKLAGTGAATMAGNVIAGGLIGLGVDAVTGAADDLTPNPATITLEKEEVAVALPAPAAPAPIAPSPAVVPAAQPAAPAVSQAAPASATIAAG